MAHDPHLPADQAPHSIWRGIHQTLSTDTVGGALLLAATVLALILANTGAAGFYDSLRDFTFGPEALHLNLSVGAWAADGLLAIFFFVVGLELKEEFVAGKLRNIRTAIVPIAAAVGGVVVPALIYVVVNLNSGAAALQGWAIPAATAIAFAVAVIAVVGRHLPPALRTFLLTLAVVDDLLAISVIAVFYTDEIDVLYLGLAVIPLAAFAVPLFAFFSAGVTVGGLAGLAASFGDTIALGIVAGLVLGKAAGITATTFLVTRLPGLRIDPSLRWIDMVGMAFVAGIGFTVSLLVGELSFGAGSESDDHVKVGVLAGSLVAASIGAVILGVRDRHYRSLRD